jgi:hypothetical protein
MGGGGHSVSQYAINITYGDCFASAIGRRLLLLMGIILPLAQVGG